jgi:anti-sigma factor ChrR (cupin superfamily)
MTTDIAQVMADLADPRSLLASREWRPLRPGVNISQFYETDAQGPGAALLHYEAGASVPSHLHQDFEHILILDGAQSDGTREYRKGSLLISPPGSSHSIHSEQGCLALAIWVKPVAFE